MPRTPEQVAADDALAEAVKRCRDAYTEDNEVGVITEYLVIYASRRWDSDGDGLTAVGRIISSPAPALHQQLGLVDYVATEFRHMIVTEDGE